MESDPVEPEVGLALESDTEESEHAEVRSSEPELLVQAIRVAASGEALVSPRATTHLLGMFAGASDGMVREPLSASEEETLLLVDQGFTNNEIVARLHLSLSTVKSNISAIMLKLGVSNRVELAVWAFQTGRAESD